jgi:MAP/microtubule affinity-regulating kinase
LKLENILIDDRNNVKIIDYGFSVYQPDDGKLKIFCGTPSYMAPEIIQKKEYSGFATDVWALGIILFVMLAGMFPFNGASEKELYGKICRGGLFHMPETVPFEARRLIT